MNLRSLLHLILNIIFFITLRVLFNFLATTSWLLTNSEDWSPFSELNISSLSQEVCCIFIIWRFIVLFTGACFLPKVSWIQSMSFCPVSYDPFWYCLSIHADVLLAVSFLQVLPQKVCVHLFLFFPIHASCPDSFVLGIITLIVFVKEYKSWIAFSFSSILMLLIPS